MENAGKAHDISRLCEALGLDPSAYVSFEKATRGNAQRGRGPAESNAVSGQEAAMQSRLSDAAAKRNAAMADAEPLQSAPPAASLAKPMQIAMLSLTGGSGKTTLAAALANALRARKHTVMLADHSLYNMLHNLFGLHGDSLTAVSFAIGTRVNTPLPVLSKYHMGERIEDYDAWYGSLAARTNFTFIDGISEAVTEGRKLIESGVRVMIPVVPELVAAMSAVTLDKALSSPWPGRLTYVLNRFDPNEALHRDVRVWLRENLGARLLPFEIPNDADLKQLAAGTIQIKDLAPYSPLRFALESTVELLEKCGAQEEPVRAEVRQ